MIERIFILFVTSFLTISTCLAQARHDANWVFGANAGINFDTLNNTTIINSICNNNEMSGAVSNNEGILLLYFDNIISGNYSVARNRHDNIINNTDSLFMFSSSASGPISIVSDNKILVFHLGDDNEPPLYQTCNSYACPRLYYSVFRIIDSDSIVLEKKNNRLLDEILYERISAVKHANGKDWWLLAHAQIDSSIFNRKNRFYKFLVQESEVIYHSYQDVGIYSVNSGDLIGQMKFSNKGNKLGLVRYESKYYEVYNFNRCDGSLEVDKGGYVANSRELYGLEFSPSEEFLYLTSNWVSGFISKRGGLFQINISTNPPNQLLIDTTDKYYGQLQFAADGYIYLANRDGSPVIFSQYNQNLSVIQQPDSMGLACDFQPFSFYLGDSSKSSIGLPNFPNYRLGALSIYEADAGKDTVLCVDSTVNQKVVVLGSPPISGVQYQWYPNYNLSSDTVAQPLAYPDSSTMYYLMLSDTSITNACKTRLDSVWVEVKQCITGTDDKIKTENNYKLHPNLYRGAGYGNIKLMQTETGKLEVYSIDGRQMHSYKLHGGNNEINIGKANLEAGVYVYRVTVNNELKQIDKLVNVR